MLPSPSETSRLHGLRLSTLAGGLARDLAAAYAESVNQPRPESPPLRQAFEQFGDEAATSGSSLEEAMAVAAEALQDLFARIGGRATDAATTIAAGIALAAVSRSFHASRDRARGNEPPPIVVPTQIARLNALHRMNRAATSNLHLSALLDITVEAVVPATGADACSIFLYDPATDSLALRAAIGLNPTSVGAVTFSAGLGITGLAAKSGSTVVAPDARNHEAYMIAPATGDAVYASQVSVPLHTRDAKELLGVLNVLSVTGRDFDQDELTFLETVAGELGISIENARMHGVTDERLRRKIAELGTLQRVSRTVASSLDLANVLRLITEAAVELIDAEAAAIFRLPGESDGSDTDGGLNIEYRVGQSRTIVDEGRRDELVVQVIESGAARISEMDYLDGSSRLYCLPLRSARETWGALCLRLRAGSELTEDELGLLQAFTDSASLAIENAQLYREAQHSVDTASTLLQEMHHRVRNNLQTVAALLSIQIRQDPESDWAIHLREAVSRIQAIASVHDLLSDESRLSGAGVDAIARLVAEEARSTTIPPGLDLTFEIPPSDVALPSRQATVLALLINELVSNAITHGFKGRSRGRISIKTTRTGPVATIEVENDGERVADDFNPGAGTGLGMRIVHRLVTSDLNGAFSIRATETGTLASITFPAPSA